MEGSCSKGSILKAREVRRPPKLHGVVEPGKGAELVSGACGLRRGRFALPQRPRLGAPPVKVFFRIERERHQKRGKKAKLFLS